MTVPELVYKRLLFTWEQFVKGGIRSPDQHMAIEDSNQLVKKISRGEYSSLLVFITEINKKQFYKDQYLKTLSIKEKSLENKTEKVDAMEKLK